MLQRIKQIFDAFGEKISAVDTLNDLTGLRVRYLGKNGEVTELLKGLKNCSPEEKPALGKKINELRQKIETALSDAEKAFNEKAKAKKTQRRRNRRYAFACARRARRLDSSADFGEKYACKRIRRNGFFR